ncbi:MAG: hypothetical protein SF069_18225 [Phycisphaerae bacterium]|nr:hypothetical protein [Phycisphaerae bacterium]
MSDITKHEYPSETRDLDHPVSSLERLISRYLDDELRSEERVELHRLMREDSVARALFDEMVAIDRAAGVALHAAAGRALSRADARAAGRSGAAFRRRWLRVLPAMATAAAASIAWWAMAPAIDPAGRGNERTLRARAASGIGTTHTDDSWFAPIRQMSEYFSPVSPEHERPQVRINQTQRDLLLIPRGVPGEYYLIEVDLTKTQVVKIQRDF